MHQNYDISSQTEINYRSTINIEALIHARPAYSTEKYCLEGERKRHSKKEKSALGG